MKTTFGRWGWLLMTAMIASAATAQESRPSTRPTPAPVYDEKADAKADIAAAVKRAGAENKRVLVVYGANWCGWCKLLAEFFKTEKAIAKTLFYEYEIVKVDVARFDKNVDIARGYGADIKQGIPYLTVLDGAGKVLTNQDTGSLENGPKHDAVKVQAFLEKWKATPLDAEEVIKTALATAAKDKKQVMAHFGAPWCGWCKRFEQFFSRTDPAAIMATDYLIVKIDIDRMTHGKDLEKRWRKKEGGIPWIAVLDDKGEPRVVSEDAKGDTIGHPWEPAEVDVFMDMLAKTRKSMTDAQMEALKKLLLAQKAEQKAK